VNVRCAGKAKAGVVEVVVEEMGWAGEGDTDPRIRSSVSTPSSRTGWERS
jgi:hypothetical protein